MSVVHNDHGLDSVVKRLAGDHWAAPTLRLRSAGTANWALDTLRQVLAESDLATSSSVSASAPGVGFGGNLSPQGIQPDTGDTQNDEGASGAPGVVVESPFASSVQAVVDAFESKFSVRRFLRDQFLDQEVSALVLETVLNRVNASRLRLQDRPLLFVDDLSVAQDGVPSTHEMGLHKDVQQFLARVENIVSF